MIAFVQVLLLLLVPVGAYWLVQRSRLVETFGPVIVCYGVGIACGNLPGVAWSEQISNVAVSATVGLAIPLLLFSVDLQRWIRLGGATIVSFLTCVGVVMGVVSALAMTAFRGVSEASSIAGMLVGVYTGGTPNMAAIGTALGVSDEAFIRLQTADVVIGGAYFFFLLSFAAPVYGFVLRPFESKSKDGSQGDECGAKGNHASEESASLPTLQPWNGQQLAFSLFLAVAVLGSAAFIGSLLPADWSDSVTIISLTTLALLASTHPQIRELPGTHDLGQYFLLVFCVAVGMMADLSQVFSGSGTMFAYVACVMILSAAIHLGLCRLLNIDRDTAIITSTAAIYGPPFVGPVAVALKNREVEASGMITGAVGLAIGNYAGIMLAWMLANAGL